MKRHNRVFESRVKSAEVFHFQGSGTDARFACPVTLCLMPGSGTGANFEFQPGASTS